MNQEFKNKDENSNLENNPIKTFNQSNNINDFDNKDISNGSSPAMADISEKSLFVRQRGSIMILFEKLTQLPLLIGTILFTLFAGASLDFDLVFPAIIIGLSPFMQLIKYFFTYYSIIDEQLIVESGLFNKKRIEIPLRSITTVDLTQNIFFQIFKSYKIKVDNGSQTKEAVNKAEVQFALKSDLALKFKTLVENEKIADFIDGHDKISNDEMLSDNGQIYNDTHTDNENENAYKNEAAKTSSNTYTDNKDQREELSRAAKIVESNPFDFVRLGALESKFIYLLSIIPLISFGSLFLGGTGIIPSEETIGRTLESLFESFPVYIIIFVVFATLFVAGFVFSIIRSITTFFGFKLTGDSNKVHIEYGLITKRKYTLLKEKITGIVLRQNILMRFFKQYQMEVIVIGYGDKSDQEIKQEPILFPIANKAKVKEIVENILPDFKGSYYCEKRDFDNTQIKSPGTDKKAIRYFFYNFGIIITTILFALGIIIVNTFKPENFLFSTGDSISSGEIAVGGDMTEIMLFNIFRFVPLAIFTCLFILNILGIVMQIKNSLIDSNKETVILQSGAFHRRLTIIKTRSIESITAISSIWKLKKGFASIKLGIVAPLRSSHLIIPNRNLKEFHDLESDLEM